ncbi:MAG: hypothetical protein AB8G15_19655 [Saprospiraceae bacterium]
MKNFKILELEKLNDTSRYKKIEEGIFEKIRDDGRYSPPCIALSMELEAGENSQYPLEDILDKYLVHVEDFLESGAPNIFKYIFGGDLAGIQQLKMLIGKRVYNEEFLDEDGRARVKLVIE